MLAKPLHMVNPELAKIYDKNPLTPIPVKDYL